MSRSPAVVLVTLAALGLAACSGDDEPDDVASIGADESAAASSDPATPGTTQTAVDDDAAVRAALEAYYPAVIAYNAASGESDALTAVATPELVDEMTRNYAKTFAGGQHLVGEWTTEVDAVEVDGDTATASICLDGTQVYVVDIGEGIGDGARGQDRAQTTVSFERVDGQWLVAGLDRSGASC